MWTISETKYDSEILEGNKNIKKIQASKERRKFSQLTFEK